MKLTLGRKYWALIKMLLLNSSVTLGKKCKLSGRILTAIKIFIIPCISNKSDRNSNKVIYDYAIQSDELLFEFTYFIILHTLISSNIIKFVDVFYINLYLKQKKEQENSNSKYWQEMQAVNIFHGLAFLELCFSLLFYLIPNR